MKKYFLLPLLTAILFTQQSQAKIWRVNNIVGVTADFTSISDAVNSTSVLSGDTIHLESSPSGYGGCVLTKRLVILGSGYFLTENAPLIPNPKTENNTNPSAIGNINFNPGSKGSVIAGVQIQGFAVVQDSLITIQRCYLFNDCYILDNSSSVNVYADTIRQNVLGGAIRCGYGSTGKIKNLLVYNNIMAGSTAIDFSQNINNADGFVINNDFTYYYAQYNGNNVHFYTVNFVYQNNIFPYVDFSAYQSSNVYFNNLCIGTGVPAGNSNQQNVDVANNVYNDWVNNGAGYSSDGRFQLKTGANPAKNAGTINSTTIDCGAFGGPAPYILSGMPNMPSIYSLTVPTQVNTGTTTMNITLSSASH